ITSQATATRSIERLNTRYAGLERASRDASTGRRIHTVSDDPAAMNRVMALTAASRMRDQEVKAAADAVTWLNSIDTTLQTSMSRLQRVRQLGVAGSNTLPADQRQSLAVELRNIQSELVNLANTTHGGRPLFGGTASGDAVSGSGTTFSYDGDSGQVLRRIGPNDVVQVNVSAQDAFFFTPPAGFSDNVFAVVEELAAAIHTGDTARAAASLEAVDTAMTQISRQLARVGAQTNHVEAAQLRTADLAAAATTERSELQNVDIAEAVLRLRSEETAYQTALAAIGKSLPPSLASFLG
ncbi:MAG TPA: flagellin, partial [Euzebyales bacterium]|nr:flagellin [Euzebyales bacterium]